MDPGSRPLLVRTPLRAAAPAPPVASWASESPARSHRIAGYQPIRPEVTALLTKPPNALRPGVSDSVCV